MRVLYLTEFFPENKEDIKGGVEARSYFIIKELDKKIKYYILSTWEKNHEKNQTIFSQSKIIRVGKQGKHIHSGGLWQRLVFILAATKKAYSLRKEIDIIEASGWLGYVVALIVKVFIKKPTLITYHEVWIGQWKKLFGWMGGLGYLAEKIILFISWDKIIAVSQDTKKELLKQNISENKIKVVYNGVEDNDIFKTSLEKFNRPTICTISRLVSYKRVNDLIKALILVKKELPNVKLKIIGVGPELENLKKQAKDLKLENNIYFLGYIKSYDDVLKILKQSHIFCLPTEKEGFGIVTIEAAACEVPFVISDIAVNKEISRQGQGGLLYKVRNTNDLAEKIIKLFNDKDLYNHKKQECSELVKNYQWLNISKQITKIYADLHVN